MQPPSSPNPPVHYIPTDQNLGVVTDATDPPAYTAIWAVLVANKRKPRKGREIVVGTFKEVHKSMFAHSRKD